MNTPKNIQYKVDTIKSQWKHRVAQEIEKQIYHTIMKWWSFFHIDRICDEEIWKWQLKLEFPEMDQYEYEYEGLKALWFLYELFPYATGSYINDKEKREEYFDTHIKPHRIS